MSQENEAKLWETIKLLESENTIYKNRIEEDKQTIETLEASIESKGELYKRLTQEVERI